MTVYLNVDCAVPFSQSFVSAASIVPTSTSIAFFLSFFLSFLFLLTAAFLLHSHSQNGSQMITISVYPNYSFSDWQSSQKLLGQALISTKCNVLVRFPGAYDTKHGRNYGKLVQDILLSIKQPLWRVNVACVGSLLPCMHWTFVSAKLELRLSLHTDSNRTLIGTLSQRVHQNQLGWMAV